MSEWVVREKDDNSPTYGNMVHTGYADISALGGTITASVPYTVNTKTKKSPRFCNSVNIVKACEEIFPEQFPYNNSSSITGNTVEENKKLCNSSIDSKGHNCYVPEGKDFDPDKPICLSDPEKCNLSPEECSKIFFVMDMALVKDTTKGGELEIKCDCDLDWSGTMCETRTCVPEGGVCVTRYTRTIAVMA